MSETTSATEYKFKFVKSKLVTSTEGAVFKIRPVSPLDYLNDRIKSEQGADAGRKFIKALLLNCVLEPKLTDKRSEECAENELSLDDLSFGDYSFLSKEITDYSTSGNANFLATGQSS